MCLARPKEGAGAAAPPEARGERSVFEDDLACHEGCPDGVLVASNHPRQPSDVRPWGFVVVVDRVVEMFGVDDHHVGSVAEAQVPGVETLSLIHI